LGGGGRGSIKGDQTKTGKAREQKGYALSKGGDKGATRLGEVKRKTTKRTDKKDCQHVKLLAVRQWDSCFRDCFLEQGGRHNREWNDLGLKYIRGRNNIRLKSEKMKGPGKRRSEKRGQGNFKSEKHQTGKGRIGKGQFRSDRRWGASGNGNTKENTAVS